MNHKEREAVITALNDFRCTGIIKVQAGEPADYGCHTAPSYRIDYIDAPSVFIPRAESLIDYVTVNMYDRIRLSHEEQAAKEAARDAELAAAQAKLDAVKARADEAAANAKWDRAETIPVELPEAFKRVAESAKAFIDAMKALKGGK